MLSFLQNSIHRLHKIISLYEDMDSEAKTPKIFVLKQPKNCILPIHLPLKESMGRNNYWVKRLVRLCSNSKDRF